MKFTATDTTLEITISAYQLTAMEYEMAVYGTPNVDAPGEPIFQIYIDNRPQWQYDRFLANVDDFEEQTGYLLGEDGEETYTISVPRS